MSTNRRKRHGGADDYRRPQKRNRLMASGVETSSQSEPEETEDSGNLSFQPEVIDLTQELADPGEEPSEPVVIDLTDDESVVIVEEDQQQERNLGEPQEQDICIVISYDEDESSDDDDDDVPPGTILCPICFDRYLEIVQSGRLIMSTMCGHLFCSRCLDESFRNANFCQICRTTTFREECHPIYI